MCLPYPHFIEVVGFFHEQDFVFCSALWFLGEGGCNRLIENGKRGILYVGEKERESRETFCRNIFFLTHFLMLERERNYFPSIFGWVLKSIFGRVSKYFFVWKWKRSLKVFGKYFLVWKWKRSLINSSLVLNALLFFCVAPLKSWFFFWIFWIFCVALLKS